MGLDITLVVSILSALVSVTVLLNFVYTRQKEREDTIRWRKGVDDRLDALTKRVDSHNDYAKMFYSAKDELMNMKEDISFIRGQLSK